MNILQTILPFSDQLCGAQLSSNYSVILLRSAGVIDCGGPASLVVNRKTDTAQSI